MPTLPATTVDFFLAGLESFMVRSGQGEHWGVTAVWLNGRPDADMLARGWREVHARHPMLGAHMRRKWRGWRLVWESAGPLVPPPVEWHACTPDQTEEDFIRERLGGMAAGRRILSPLWLEVFAFGDAGRHLVLLTWRHAFMDGTGVNLLLEKLAAGKCEADPPEPAKPPTESAARLYQKAKPLIDRLRATTHTGCLSAWIRGLPPPGVPAYHRVALSTEQSRLAAAKLRDLCGEFFQMPFYAAVAARAMRQLHKLRGWTSPELHLQLPTQTRGRSRDLLFGNHMGTLPLFLDAGALGSLPEAVAHVQQCYKEAIKTGMPQASEAMMALACHLPVRAFIPLVRLPNCGQICSLFHSHTGAFLPGRTDFAGAAVQDVCTIPSVCAPPGLGLFFSDYSGKITATLAWRAAGVSADEVKALETQIMEDLTL
ncbi:MAG TPA: hypothetical protein VGE39_02790 [Prosthecobacter sp.]